MPSMQERLAGSFAPGGVGPRLVRLLVFLSLTGIALGIVHAT